MILLYSNKINTFYEILEKYNNMVNLPYLECPNCKGNNLIRHAKYERNIKYINNNEIKQEIITILRVKCKNCGTTHALLPVCIVPYKTSTLEVIFKAIRYEEITLNISLDTIHNWQRDFNKFLPYIKTMFSNISNSKIIDVLIRNIGINYYKFYIQYRKILMMMKSGLKNIVHF